MLDCDPRVLQLTFSPDLRTVKHVRRFVAKWFDDVLHDEDGAWRAMLASHELLENAVKCSTGDHTSLHIEVFREAPGGRAILVSTRNRSSPENIAQLVRAIADLRGANDVFSHYQTLMQQSARRAEGSGLGLARLCAEAEMQLTSTVDDDCVTILAHVTLAEVAA